MGFHKKEISPILAKKWMYHEVGAFNNEDREVDSLVRGQVLMFNSLPHCSRGRNGSGPASLANA